MITLLLILLVLVIVVPLVMNGTFSAPYGIGGAIITILVIFLLLRLLGLA